MAHQWRGVIREYAERLPSLDGMPVVTLLEGGTPLIPAEHLSSLVGAEVWLKFEGLNPTGSFKDRGMTTAISVAAGHGAKAVICASTGNTSASAAAYATKAGMTCGVLVPEGKIAMGKLSQAIAHGATLLQVEGNFDDCLTLARKLAEAYPIDLVNSVNPARIEGQKTAAFEVVDALGDAPDIHCLPVGNAGNITAYWLGYQQYQQDSAQPGPATHTPEMWGFQAAGAAPIVLGHPVDEPETIATAIRIGNPASWKQAEAARDESGGLIHAVTDEQILAAHRLVSSKEGVFVEPGSAASVAGLLASHEAGLVPAGRADRLHGHGARPQGPAVGAAPGRRVRARPGAGVRRRGVRGRRARPRRVSRGMPDRPAVRIRVPASTANLGPGFDSVGLALGLWDEYDVSVGEGDGLQVSVSGEGAEEVPRDATHLVVRAMAHGFARLETHMPASLCLVARNGIPHSRGLGSSASAIVAGVVAAQVLSDLEALARTEPGTVVDVDLDVATDLSTELEGHPDNASASVRGGMTVSWSRDPDDPSPSATGTASVATHPEVTAVVLVPREQLATHTARAVLPASRRPRRRRPQLGPRGAARRGDDPASRPPAAGDPGLAAPGVPAGGVRAVHGPRRRAPERGTRGRDLGSRTQRRGPHHARPCRRACWSRRTVPGGPGSSRASPRRGWRWFGPEPRRARRLDGTRGPSAVLL